MNCTLFFCQREYVCTCSDVVTCTTVVEAHAVRALPSRIPDREGVEAFLPSPLGVSMQQSRHSRQFWLDLTLIYVHGSLPRFREFAQISRTFGREFKVKAVEREREWRRKTCSYREDCLLELSRIFTNARKPRVAKERELCLHSYYIFVKTKALASANFASKANQKKNATQSRNIGYARSA